MYKIIKEQIQLIKKMVEYLSSLSVNVFIWTYLFISLWYVPRDKVLVKKYFRK